jgi:hypothetical protein
LFALPFTASPKDDFSFYERLKLPFSKVGIFEFDIGRLFDALVALSIPIVKSLLDFTKLLTPQFLHGWIEAYKSASLTFTTLVILACASFYWGAVLDRRLKDRALASWNGDWDRVRTRWRKRSLELKKFWAIALAIIFALIATTYAFEIYTNPTRIEWVEPPVSLDVKLLLLSLALCTSSVFWLRFLRKDLQSSHEGEVPGFALWLSNAARTSEPLQQILHFARWQVVPVLTAILFVGLAATAANQFLFRVMDYGNWVCPQYSPDANWLSEKIPVAASEVDPGIGCNSTTARLRGGQTYGITIIQKTSFPSPYTDGAILNTVKLPFRRSLQFGWNEQLVKVGTEELRLERYDETLITPKDDGYLWYFVNQPIIGLPIIWNSFYSYSGRGILVVRLVQSPSK